MSIDWSIVLQKTVAVLFLVTPTIWLLRAFWSTQNAAKYGSRKRSAKAIDKLRRKGAVKQLINVFNFCKDRKLKSYQRFWAAQALGDLKDPLAVKPLIDALSGADDLELVEEIAPVLAKHGAAGLDVICSLLDQFRVGRVRVEGVDPQDDPENLGKVRLVESIVQGLGESRDKACVPVLIRVMQWNGSRIASEAAEALGKIGDQSAIKPLREELRSNKIRREIVHAALAGCGDREIADELVTHLQRAVEFNDYTNLTDTLKGLRHFRDPRAVSPLVTMILGGYGTSDVFETLAEIDDPQAIAALAHWLGTILQKVHGKDSREGFPSELIEPLLHHLTVCVEQRPESVPDNVVKWLSEIDVVYGRWGSIDRKKLRKAALHVLNGRPRRRKSEDKKETQAPDEPKGPAEPSSPRPRTKKNERVSPNVCPHCGKQTVIVASLCPYCGKSK